MSFNSTKRTLAKIPDLKLFSKIGANFAIKIVGLFMGYLNLILIAKFYGALDLGIYTICFTILSIMQVVSKFGLETSIIKLVNEVGPDKGRTIGNLIAKSIFFSLAVGVILSLSLHWLSPIVASLFNNDLLTEEIKTISFGIVPFSLLYLFASIFQSIDDVKKSMLLKHLLIQFLFGILLFSNEILQYDYSVVDAYFGAILLGFLISLFLFLQKSNRVGYKLSLIPKQSDLDLIPLSKIISLSFPMLLSTSVFFLMGWTDNLMLGGFVTEDQVGFFNVCLKLSTTIGVSLVVVNSIAAQKFASCYARGEMSELKSMVHASTKYIFYLALPPFLILLLFPKFMLGIFGSEFSGSYLTLILLVFGQFFNAICGSVGFLMQMCGLHKEHQYIVIFAAVLNALINYILIPKYGILGAAIANTFSTFLWNILMVLSVKKNLGFWTFYRPFIKSF